MVCGNYNAFLSHHLGNPPQLPALPAHKWNWPFMAGHNSNVTGFVWVLKNLESHGILFFSFPGLESHGILCRVMESHGNFITIKKI